MARASHPVHAPCDLPARHPLPPRTRRRSQVEDLTRHLTAERPLRGVRHGRGLFAPLPSPTVSRAAAPRRTCARASSTSSAACARVAGAARGSPTRAESASAMGERGRRDVLARHTWCEWYRRCARCSSMTSGTTSTALAATARAGRRARPLRPDASCCGGAVNSPTSWSIGIEAHVDNLWCRSSYEVRAAHASATLGARTPRTVSTCPARRKLKLSAAAA